MNPRKIQQTTQILHHSHNTSGKSRKICRLWDHSTHAAFEAWKNLKFDPAKDDVEEFMTNIKNLASTLAFNEEAQVMTIKSNMPRDIYGLCMQYDKLDELKKFLIELFENPRMKSAVPSITAEADTSAFSMGEFVNNDVVSATSEDIGKLKNEI